MFSVFSVFLFLEFHERGSTCAREAREVFNKKKKSRGTCVVGLILKKCGPPKKVGSVGWGPKSGTVFAL